MKNTNVNVNNTKVFAIESRSILESKANEILKFDRFSYYTLVVDKDPSKTSIFATEVPSNRFLREAKVEDEIMVITQAKSLKKLSKDGRIPFTCEYLSLDIDDLKMINMLLKNGIHVVFNGINTAVYVKVPNGYKNILDGVNYPIYSASDIRNKPLAFVTTVPENARLFKGFTYSASNIRTIQLIMKDVTDGDDRDQKLDHISNGAFKRLKDQMQKIELMKTGPRFGQAAAGSVDFGIIPGWVFYRGKFVDNNGDNIWDGMNFFRSDFIAECISDRLGLSVSPQATESFNIQNRPATVKCFGDVVSPNVFTGILKRLPTDKLEVYGDPNNVVMIVDESGVKLDFDFNAPLHLEVLAFAIASNARVSKQFIEKMMYIAKDKAMSVVNDLFATQLNNDINKAIFERKAEIPTPEEIESGYIIDTVLKIAPNYLTKDPAFFLAVVRTLIQRFVKTINKMSISCAGANVRLLADVSHLLCGHNLLELGEVFMKAAAPDMKADKRVKNTVMIKYPSMGIKEVYVAKIVTFSEMKKRINALPISDEEKTLLIEYYANRSTGVAVLPAADILKYQCAGLDFDFDGATFFWDPDVTELFEKFDAEAVVIG